MSSPSRPVCVFLYKRLHRCKGVGCTQSVGQSGRLFGRIAVCRQSGLSLFMRMLLPTKKPLYCEGKCGETRQEVASDIFSVIMYFSYKYVYEKVTAKSKRMHFECEWENLQNALNAFVVIILMSRCGRDHYRIRGNG